MMTSTYQYIVTTNKIHKFQILEYNEQIIDLLIDDINHIFHMVSSDTPIFLLIEMQNTEIVYLRQMILRLKDIVRTYPQHNRLYTAIVIEDVTLLDIADTLMRTLIQRERIQYFTDAEKARFWLRLEKQKIGKSSS